MLLLPEADALEIARYWSNKLQDLYESSIEVKSVHTRLLPELEVSVSSKRNQREILEIDPNDYALVRETLGVWRALACCCGYGGYENPRFWDTVVRVFLNDADLPEGFRRGFHDENKEPSLIRLKCVVQGVVASNDSNKENIRQWMRTVCQALFEFPARPEKRKPPSDEYQATLLRLQPYMNHQKLTSEKIAVHLQIGAWTERRRFYADPDILATMSSIFSEIAAASESNELVASSAAAASPRLHLESVEIVALGTTTTPELEAVSSVLRRTPVPFSSLRLTINPNVAFRAASEFVVAALQIPDLKTSNSTDVPALQSPGKLQSLTYLISSMTPHRFACLFSALPYSHSVQNLELYENRVGPKWTLDECQCRWLAYAIFHPRTKTASWEGIELREGTLDAGMSDLLNVLFENPLRTLSITHLAVLAGAVPADKAQGDRLRIATVKTGSSVWLQSNTGHDALIELGGETELEMCDLQSSDWYCVLVPGYGFGWVQQGDVAQTRDWLPDTPLSSALKGLTLFGCFTSEDTLGLLAGCGNNLEKLSLENAYLSSDVVGEVLLNCPDLRSLSISGGGEMFTSALLEKAFSRNSSALESLTVTWKRCNIPVLLHILTNWADKDAVKRLKHLRIMQLKNDSSFGPLVTSCEAMLTSNKSLERLSFTAFGPRWDMRTPGASLEVHNGEDLRREAHLKERWAFLSLVRHHAEHHTHSPQSRLDSAVIAIIFTFGALPVRRLVYFIPPPHEVVYYR